MENRIKEFIITPGLYGKVKQFEAHYNTLKKDPLMIIGPTGVGKSLFLKLFKTLYLDDKKNRSENDIVEANCAHFGSSNSDPNIARTELFGCVEVPGTNLKSRPGLIENANGGVLILEEIGELPSEVQAMLLTFIETGKYRKLGSYEKEEKADVHIVGATNNESKLRDEFRYRFSQFYVPPLYERRIDILHYWYYKFPEIVETFKGWEALTLLAYNWPGNVREIERIGNIIKREKSYDDEWEYQPKLVRESNLFRILSEGPAFTDMDPSKLFYLDFDLAALSDVNRGYLEAIMNTFGLGISVKNSNAKLPLNKTEIGNELLYADKVIEKKFKIKVYRIGALHDVYNLFRVFCAFFHLDEFEDANILDNILSKDLNEMLSPPPPEELIKEILDRQPGIITEINTFLKKIRRFRTKSELSEKYDTGINIWTMKFDELYEAYHKGLMELVNGDPKQASILSGIKKTTLRDRLDKLNISYKKKDLKK